MCTNPSCFMHRKEVDAPEDSKCLVCDFTLKTTDDAFAALMDQFGMNMPGWFK
jgi:hypothetical protein